MEFEARRSMKVTGAGTSRDRLELLTINVTGYTPSASGSLERFSKGL